MSYTQKINVFSFEDVLTISYVYSTYTYKYNICNAVMIYGEVRYISPRTCRRILNTKTIMFIKYSSFPILVMFQYENDRGGKRPRTQYTSKYCNTSNRRLANGHVTFILTADIGNNDR